jgi:hypothetical protein
LERLRRFRFDILARRGRTFLWYFLERIFLWTPFKVRVSRLSSWVSRNLPKPLALTIELRRFISKTLIVFSVSERFEKNLSKASKHLNLQLLRETEVRLGKDRLL